MIRFLKVDDEKCTGCSTCASVCSKMYAKTDDSAKSRIQVLPLGNNKFHLAVCNQECRKCVAECPVEALSVNVNGVVMLNKNLCVGCLACVAVCPIGAIRYYPGEAQPFKCVACGACVKKCPRDALAIEEKEDTPLSKEYLAPTLAVRQERQ